MKYPRLFLGTKALFIVLFAGCKKEVNIDPEQSLDAIKNSAKSSAPGNLLREDFYNMPVRIKKGRI